MLVTFLLIFVSLIQAHTNTKTANVTFIVIEAKAVMRIGFGVR